MRGAASPVRDEKVVVYISTHAPHARRGADRDYYFKIGGISTHAPHARRGFGAIYIFKPHKYFYSRASCEARRYILKLGTIIAKFLLTRLMRGAASQLPSLSADWIISTHAPHARRGSSAVLTRS